LADNPAKWYVFRSTECECSDVDGDVRPFKRVVKGEKFKYITVPLPGITLYKRRTQTQDDAS
uniref:Transposase n=1 Tax=Gongylonema pulchrum TaxID=637853 RepID=A0A183F0B8_9BILA